nr:60S ribosomal protein L18a-like protein [Tanacetum cinerariifolium]
MAHDAAMEEGKVSKHGFEFVKLVPDRHLDPLRPSNHCFSMFKGHAANNMDCVKDRYTFIKDVDEFQVGMFDRPLPCFGCGVGWFSFLVGFAFPLMWYYATFLYFANCYQRDPRERAGLAAAAIAAMGLSVGLLIATAILLL